MLETQASWQLPLNEVSALSLRNGDADEGVELLAVDDERRELAVAEIAAGAVLPPAEAQDVEAAVLAVSAAGASDGSDFEGVASDASRRVFVVQEGADRVLVFDQRLGIVEQTITVSVPPDQPDFGLEWHADDNARAEGLLLLRSGHILVAKQREMPRLIEFGPADDGPAGFAPGDALAPTETFPLAGGSTVAFGVVASWRVDPDSGLESINDLAVDADGRLHLVSSKSRSLARLDAALEPTGETAALTTWPLPADLFESDDDKAEGLVFAPELGWLVALDLERLAPNLFQIGGVPR
jgi:hypothetical protein